MSFADLQTMLRAEERAAVAARRPQAQMKVTGLTDFMGIPIQVNQFVPKDQIIVTNGLISVDSHYAVLRLQHGCNPLFSRYTIGTREAERDRLRR